jgi:tetratricopeptide (TPR) repeat protein
MRALIDWSYDLLSEEERALFRTLSIFAGGFTFEAAAAVCGVDGSDDIAVLDRLTSVVDKSLVQADVSPEGTRYRMLESTRQYARERLIEQGEFSAVALAHARAFLALAEKLDRLYDTTEDRKWRAQAGPEMDNCRAALEWVLTGDADVALGQRLAANMRWMFVHFAATEGRRWIRTALAATGPAIPDDVIGKLELADAQIDIVFMQHKASYEAAARAAEKLQRANDPAMVEAQRTAARGLMFLGSVAESEARLRQALVSAERFGLRKLKAAIFADLAILRQNVGDLDEARALFTQARELARAINPQSGMAFVTTNLAELEYRAGNMRVAVALSSEALAESRARGNTREMWFELFNLSAYLIALGEYGDARDYACEALRIARELEAGVLAALSLQHLAAVALFRDERYNDAAYLLGYIDARVAALEGVREYTEEQEYEKIVSTLRAHFGEEPLAKLMAEGSNWTEERAVSEATSVFK